ncbi:MAG: tRNA nucleotidyltransferase [Firmicutes bacterium]|nr:tRNA nucleotidyltransferase [Bacillota bacterium]
MKIAVPIRVKLALSLLTRCGYEAYLVGGCVRDALLELTPIDYDIATNALPEQVKETFASYRIIDTGLQHGTLTVIIDSMPIEISTFRGGNSSKVTKKIKSIGGGLQNDLCHRDFTINAMAYHPHSGLIDFFDGVIDLQNRRIKSVGRPAQRFCEDPLRILRALRLAATLQFTIEQETAKSMHRYKMLLQAVANERLGAEVRKLLCGQGAKQVLLESVDILGVFIPELLLSGDAKNKSEKCGLAYEAQVVGYVPAVLSLRLAALLHTLGYEDEGEYVLDYGNGAKMAVAILSRLKFEHKTIKRVRTLILYHALPLTLSSNRIKHMLNELSDVVVVEILQLKRAIMLARRDDLVRLSQLQQMETMVNCIIADQQCYSLKQLAVNGDDLRGIGLAEGKQIGDVLNQLLEAVIDGNVPNEREALLRQASLYTLS